MQNLTKHIIDNKEEISTDYLQTFFTLFPVEIRLLYNNNTNEAEKNTRHLAQASEGFMRTRKNKMFPVPSRSRNSIRKDFFISENRMIYFMSRRVYQCYFDGNPKKERLISKNVKMWRLLRDLDKDSVLYSDKHVYSCKQIKRVCSVLYRTYNSVCHLTISSEHEFLVFNVAHAVILLKPTTNAINSKRCTFFN
ncbi:hypothetical protein [Candidatus Lokiarchaeum ossiferum]|uniref:hypothetical protein n=1 Tax=Candidatus Lokiarchaeum ossiferum TaxID=2951803 RepID=UPI00352FA4C8